jgi:hypothetical protein
MNESYRYHFGLLHPFHRPFPVARRDPSDCIFPGAVCQETPQLVRCRALRRPHLPDGARKELDNIVAGMIRVSGWPNWTQQASRPAARVEAGEENPFAAGREEERRVDRALPRLRIPMSRAMVANRTSMRRAACQSQLPALRVRAEPVAV